MFALILPLFFQFGQPAVWGDRPLDNVHGAQHFPRQAQHAQVFYNNGQNAGYFNDGQVRADHGHNKNDYNFKGHPMRDDATLKQAQQNIDAKWKEKKYGIIGHNCRQYKNEVNKEYNRIAGQNGFGPLNHHL